MDEAKNGWAQGKSSSPIAGDQGITQAQLQQKLQVSGLGNEEPAASLGGQGSDRPVAGR